MLYLYLWRAGRRPASRALPAAAAAAAAPCSLLAGVLLLLQLLQLLLLLLTTKTVAAAAEHLELLVRAALNSVFELCSLIASRPFSASPHCNPQPGDRHFGLFFCQCSYSTILRGCGPASPAFRLVDLHAPPLPFLPAATSSLLTTTTTPRPPLTV
jgi:hypothetical protein